MFIISNNDKADKDHTHIIGQSVEIKTGYNADWFTQVYITQSYVTGSGTSYISIRANISKTISGIGSNAVVMATGLINTPRENEIYTLTRNGYIVRIRISGGSMYIHYARTLTGAGTGADILNCSMVC